MTPHEQRLTKRNQELERENAKLQAALNRAHLHNEELREKIWGNKLAKNQAEQTFEQQRDNFLSRAW